MTHQPRHGNAVELAQPRAISMKTSRRRHSIKGRSIQTLAQIFGNFTRQSAGELGPHFAFDNLAMVFLHGLRQIE